MAAIPSRTFMLAIVFTMLMALTCWAKWLTKREVTGIPKSVGEILVGRTANGVTQVTTLAGVTILSDKRQSSDKAS